MAKATVSVKGQVTIPKEIRLLAHISEGSELNFHYESGIVTIRPVTKTLSSLKGIVKSKRKSAATLKEMKQAILKHVKKPITITAADAV